VDDMGWSDIGPYGGEIPTPSLDTLGRRGVSFTEFYATPRCSPTRASLLTCLYPHQAGMGHLDTVIRPRSSGTTGRINDRSVTIAEVLREGPAPSDRPTISATVGTACDAVPCLTMRVLSVFTRDNDEARWRLTAQSITRYLSRRLD
jgi:hypothetical protein